MTKTAANTMFLQWCGDVLPKVYIFAPRLVSGTGRGFGSAPQQKHTRYAQLHMGLFDIFKHKTKIKGAGATLYPDKIVIETVDRIKNSYGVTSSNVTMLKADVDSVTLGQTLRRHLDQSRDNLKTTETGDYKDYLKAAGFKTRKEHYKNAIHLTVDKRNNRISLNPTINGGPTGKDRGFSETKETIILSTTVTDKELGDQIRYGWSKCECNCA